ncbi:MAG: putative phosphoribosyltransferase [Edaphobacter sp.]|nr:putative phosphoribosyltransferase [Edaphobacter sp.]
MLSLRSGSEAMIFRDREDAGRKLAAVLSAYAGREDVVVLGLPRGGVPVGYEIAKALGASLDVFLARKLGVPGQEELAFGAVAAGGGRVLDGEMVRRLRIPEEAVERITRETLALLEQRAALYRGSRASMAVEGRTVVLVDDGVATGASLYAAIDGLRQIKPGRVVVAVPVATAQTCAWLRTMVDEVVCLHAPRDLIAVSEFYERFGQVEDDEVVRLLGA